MAAEEQLLKVFVHEASEQVDNLEEALLAVEERPSDIDTLNTAMGLAHTLKGSAGTVGLSGLAELVHELEGCLDELRKKRIPASSDLFNRLFETLDALRGGVASLAKGDYQEDRIEAARRSVQAWRQAIALGEAPAPASSSDSDDLHLGEYDQVRINVLRKQGRRLYRVTVRCATQGETDPVPAALQALRRVCDVVASCSQPSNGTEARLLLLLGSSMQREALLEALSKAGFGDADLTEWDTPVGPIPSRTPRRPEHVEETVRVAVDRLDRLMEMVGELVIVESMVKNAPEIAGVSSQHVRNSMRLLTRISLDLQDTAMSMRMVPLRGAFRRMERLVRDLARSTGKQVRLEVRGETTEVDRAIADRLAEPLIHLVRNSIDHGVEDEAERRNSGKAAVSTIRLSAAHEGGAIVIEVGDDGRGLNRESILAKARILGLVAGDVPLSDRDLMSLIFTPSFSTAKAVTEISGRGIGLDVVKRVVDSMRGTIAVASAPGQGTTFRIVLPLTLAIINGTLVQCGDECYVIPTLNIVECLHPDAGQLASYGGGIQLLRVRGDLVPMLSLARALAVECTRESAQQLVIVVESTGRRVGLVVDDVLSQQQVVIKSLNAAVFDPRLFSGAAILSNGRIGLILNIDELTAPRPAAEQPVGAPIAPNVAALAGARLEA